MSMLIDGTPVNTFGLSHYIFGLAEDTYSTPANNFAPQSNLFADLILPKIKGSTSKVHTYLNRHADRATGRLKRSLEEIAFGANVCRATAWRALQELKSWGVVDSESDWVIVGAGTPDKKAAQTKNWYTLTRPDQWKLDGVSIKIEVVPKGSRSRKKEHPGAQKFPVSEKNEQALTNSFSNSDTQNNNTARPIEKLSPDLKGPAHHVVVEIDETQKQAEVNCSVVQSLCSKGVSQPVARDLASKHAHDYIQTQIDCLPSRHPQDEAAVLVKAIREDWKVPAGYIDQRTVLAALRSKPASECYAAQKSEPSAVLHHARAGEHLKHPQAYQSVWDDLPEDEREKAAKFGLEWHEFLRTYHDYKLVKAIRALWAH